ncbi:hypothetical protein [Mycobacterium sp. IS-1742]|uniref:hypothetical protein n=1 Tax=Mycobacterium sp. IS-1742 TaxID=1772285 RepID=UPI000B0D43A0|nr:hypothetical protein [Mycobacterium sp. IS-1742]
MGRTIGRVGGASAGVIAIVFGVLDLLGKVPPPWVPLALGGVAIAGVLADYLVERRGGDGQTPSTVKQKQVGRKGSMGLQAGRDIRDVKFGDGEDSPTRGGDR